MFVVSLFPPQKQVNSFIFKLSLIKRYFNKQSASLKLCVIAAAWKVEERSPQNMPLWNTDCFNRKRLTKTASQERESHSFSSWSLQPNLPQENILISPERNKCSFPQEWRFGTKSILYKHILLQQCLSSLSLHSYCGAIVSSWPK